jgi:hypothetical protein
VRGGEPVLRKGTKPNCKECPKKSPEQAHLYELSRPNRLTLELYWQYRGRPVQDPIMLRNFGIIEQLYREHEMQVQVQLFTGLLQASAP